MRTTLLLCSALCAGGVFTLASAQEPDKKPKKDRDHIVREELVEIAPKAPDLMQAIRKLRPHFLQPQRGPRTTGISSSGSGLPVCTSSTAPGTPCERARGEIVAGTLPVLYIDDAKMGELDHLKNMVTQDIADVIYMSPNKAGVEFGLGHDGGAILVKTFKGVTKPPPAF